MVSDFFLSETAACADVVLPSAQWAEEEGTMTNLEGRVILRQRAMQPPRECANGCGDHFSGWRKGWGADISSHRSPRKLFEELRRASAGGIADYSGITWERIRRADGIFWPCPGEDHPGTPRLFLERFGTGDGRARFHPVPFRHAMEEPDEEYPLYLTTGRIMAQYQSGTQTRRIAALMTSTPEAFVQIHPSMARTYGIAEGDLCQPDYAAREGGGEGAADAIHPHGHFVRSFSLRGRGTRQSVDEPGARPDFPNARIQSLRSTYRERKYMLEKPAFIQGLFACHGQGLDKPGSFDPPVTYMSRPTNARRRSISGRVTPRPR